MPSLVNSALLTGGTQVVIQGLGFVAAVMIIRGLEPNDYAVYTLAISFVGALSAVADSGIGSNVLAQCGRVWGNAKQISAALAAGHMLRTRLALLVLMLFTPIMLFLFWGKFGNSATILIVVLATGLAFLSQLPVALLEAPLKLHEDLLFLLISRLSASALRLLAVFIVLQTCAISWILIASTSLTQIMVNGSLRKRIARLTTKETDPDSTALRELRSVILRTLPTTIYFAVSGQVSIWLLAYFGVVQAVAEVGALGRLAVVSALVVVVFDTVIVPRFAKLPAERVRRQFYLICTFSAASLTVAAACCISTIEIILMLLGDHYSHLKHEGSLLVVATALTMQATFVWSLSACRAFVPPWYVYPAFGTFGYAASSLLIGFQDAKSVLAIGVATATIGLLVNIGVFLVMSTQSNQLDRAERR